MSRNAARNDLAERVLRHLKTQALANSPARDGALLCECRRLRRKEGQAIGSLRYTFKLNGHVVSKIAAARWIAPDQDLLY